MGQNKPLSVEQGNKLIALFMGATYKSWKDNKTNRYRFNEPIGETYAFLARELKYHTSYDWLMPVVEKIEDLREGITPAWRVEIINRNMVEIVDINGERSVFVGNSKLSKIEAVWLAVVQFIQWYNLQNSNK